MSFRRARLLLLSTSIALVAVATAGGTQTAEEDRICFSVAAVSPGGFAPGSPATAVECMAPQPVVMVPLVRVDAALMDALRQHTASGATVPVTVFLDEGGKAMRLEPLPSPLNVVLIPDAPREGGMPALALLRGPSARLPVGPEGLHLFLGGFDSWLVARWDTPGPCPLQHDGDQVLTPAFARLGSGERLTSTFQGTEPGCPSGSFTLENLGGWTFA